MQLLVDGHHLAFRLRYSRVWDLATNDGRRSGVIYGFLRSLAYARHVAGATERETTIVLDGGRSKNRLELCPEYKSGRRKKDQTPEDKADTEAFFAQVEELKRALPLLGIRVVCVPGVEADDLISIFAHFYGNLKKRVLIFSGDKDFHSIVSDYISLFVPDNSDREVQGPEEIHAKWNLSSGEEILLARAIEGDASDAIPGVPKLGKKRAQNIVAWLSSGEKEPPRGLKKWVDVYRENTVTVARNLQMMRLPTRFQNSFLTIEQAEQAIEQFRVVPARDPMAFAEFCRDWQIHQEEGVGV